MPLDLVIKGSLVTLVAQFSGEGMGCKWRRGGMWKGGKRTGQLNQERSCKSMASAEVSAGDFDRQRWTCGARGEVVWVRRQLGRKSGAFCDAFLSWW